MRALEGVEPWQLRVWEAMYRLDPWGDDWTQAARIEAAIKNQYATDPIDPYELIPNEDNRPPAEEISNAEISRQLRARAGF